MAASSTAQPRRPAPLADPGGGAGKTLFFDCFSGIAGNMTVGALLDLGVPVAAIEAALGALPLSGYRLQVEPRRAAGIAATHFEVAIEGRQPERTFAAIDAMLQAAPLAGEVRDLSRRIFRRLGEAESQVHRIPLEQVHFHEVGAVDSIVDIVGAAAALAHLQADLVVSSPLPLGHGFVTARHGTLPVPAPATVGCLAGVPTYGAGVEAELVTPTGAAIIACVAQRFERWPAIEPERVGYGAGTRELPDRPNLLRAVLGSPAGPAAAGVEPYTLVAANIDDMTGELAGHALEALLAAGAADAWITPITMKKGRPGWTIAALAARPAADDVAAALLRETTSIGVRKLPVTRLERPRRMVDVATRFGTLPVKVSTGAGVPPQIKPELDACARAAASHGVPLRVVIAEALRVFSDD